MDWDFVNVLIKLNEKYKEWDKKIRYNEVEHLVYLRKGKDKEK